MSLLKRSAAASAALLTALSLASCGKETTWGANIDGIRIPAGIFILYQSNALSEAYSYLGEGETDVLGITIEDKPAVDWINDKAVEDMKKYAAYETKFDELGLSFSNNEDKLVASTAEQWWEYIGEQYESFGISKNSYVDAGINARKASAIFDYYYGEGGEKEIPEEDIKTYLNDNYARIKYVELSLKDAEGNVLKSEDKENIKKMADEYIERLKNGESTDVISEEYQDYLDSLSETEDSSTEGNSDEDTSADSTDEDASSDTEESTAETEEDPDYGTVISKDSTLPAASVTEKVFDGSIGTGDYVLVDDYETYYIVSKLDLFEDPDYFENNAENARHALKDDEFNETVNGWLAEQDAEINQAAVDRYKPDKLIG